MASNSLAQALAAERSAAAAASGAGFDGTLLSAGTQNKVGIGNSAAGGSKTLLGK